MAFLLGFFHSMAEVMQESLRAKTIPYNKRGIVLSFSNMLVGLFAAWLCFFAGAHIIEPNAFGNDYAVIFLLTFLLGLAGVLSLLYAKEGPSSVVRRRRQSVLSTAANMRKLLFRDAAFSRFILARSLAALGKMAMPFYILMVAQSVEISGLLLGQLSLVWLIAGCVMNLGWGVLADHLGCKIAILITLSLWAASHLILLFSTSVAEIMIFFAVLGGSSEGFVQSSKNMVLEFGHSDRVSMRLGVSSMFYQSANMIAPLIGGAILIVGSYSELVVTFIVLQGLAFLLFLIGVPESRSLVRQASPGF